MSERLDKVLLMKNQYAKLRMPKLESWRRILQIEDGLRQLIRNQNK